MFRLVIFTTVLVGIIGVPVFQRTLESRVVGGFPADIEDFPYQLLVEFTGRQHCGASIISDVYAITAAHCVHQLPASNFTLRAGSTKSDSGGTLHQVTKIIENEFNEQNADYDIAILKVEPPFRFGVKVKPIAPTNSTPAAGTPSVVSGWGTTDTGSTTILQQVPLYIVDHEECNTAYIGVGEVTDRMLCAGVPNDGQGSCRGDSGGPLVAGGELVGVVSWSNGCGDKNYPGVYADVAVFRDWIKQHTGV